MEVSSSLQHLDDSFFFGWLDCGQQPPPSFDRLAANAGHSFRISTSSSFIDLYPDDLFSIDLTTATSDFNFDLPVVDDGPPSPVLQISASQIFPCEPGGDSGAQEDGDDSVTRQYHTADVQSAPWSLAFHSAPSTPVSRSPYSSATSKHASQRPTLGAGRRRASAPLRKVLRFLMPLYRKVRAIAPRQGRVTLAASPARGATSSVEWCNGSADTAVHDAILYCKKSSWEGNLYCLVKGPCPGMKMMKGWV